MTVKVKRIGTATRLEYRRGGDAKNKTRVHVFGPRVRVYVTADDKHLVIAGGAMRVSKGEIRG